MRRSNTRIPENLDNNGVLSSQVSHSSFPDISSYLLHFVCTLFLEFHAFVKDPGEQKCEVSAATGTIQKIALIMISVLN